METICQLSKWLKEQYVCPVDHVPLIREGDFYVSKSNRRNRHPIVSDIPVFLRSDISHTAWWAEESLNRAMHIAEGTESPPKPYWDGAGVHPHVLGIIDSTGGHLYRASKGQLARYPIPKIRMPFERSDQVLLDVGCNWGRWTFSAARQGVSSVGVDPSLDAVIAAIEIRDQLGLSCEFFVGDCRWLPFREGTFDKIFSYGVIQHFSKSDAKQAISELQRILSNDGSALVQMPNMFGIRSLYHLARRGFAKGKKFDVRYYTPGELRKLVTSIFGNAELSVDGYFGLGVQPDDMEFMPPFNRAVIRSSELLRAVSGRIGILKQFADSLYVASSK